MFNINDKYPIGIDISDQHIYAAQFRETKAGMSVGELFDRKLDNLQEDGSESDDALIYALKDIAKNKRFRGKRAVIHLPPKLVYSFPVTFETGIDETIEDAIVKECRRHLSFPLEEAVIDYPSIYDISSGKTKKFTAVVIAVRKDEIERYTYLLKRAGLWAEAIDFDLSSLLRLHNYLYAIKGDPVILCNIGQSQSLVAVVTENSILAYRNTPWGTHQLLNRLESNLELSENSEQATEMLARYGLSYEQHISSDDASDSKTNEAQEDTIEICRSIFKVLSPYVESLIHELYQITGYVRSEMQGAKFAKMFLYGQAVAINFLDQYLEKRIEIPTECINPMDKLVLSDHSILPNTTKGSSFALALGLAMRKVTWF